MGPLAKLPVFWALDGKRVVVAGGSDTAPHAARYRCQQSVTQCTCKSALRRRSSGPFFEIFDVGSILHLGGNQKATLVVGLGIFIAIKGDHFTGPQVTHLPEWLVA